MKKNLRKLTLGRETLQKLDKYTDHLAVGGVTNGTTCTDSEVESCGGSCVTRCSACCCV